MVARQRPRRARKPAHTFVKEAAAVIVGQLAVVVIVNGKIAENQNRVKRRFGVLFRNRSRNQVDLLLLRPAEERT